MKSWKEYSKERMINESMNGGNVPVLSQAKVLYHKGSATEVGYEPMSLQLGGYQWRIKIPSEEFQQAIKDNPNLVPELNSQPQQGQPQQGQPQQGQPQQGFGK